MAMAIYPPYNKANKGGVTYPRDASFSSYLDTAERDYVRSLAESVNSPSPVRGISTTPRISMPRGNLTRAPRNAELDVFGAEKYFNEKSDDKKGSTSPLPPRSGSGHSELNQKSRHGRVKRDDLSLDQKKSPRSNISRTSSLKSPTPSLKSEVSWNSQIGLFLPKKGSVGSKIFSGFQCRGSCFDKKSVYITNTHQIVRSSPKYQGLNGNNGYRKSKLSPHDHFSFPIIDTASYNLEQPRKSMEVFGLHHIGKQEIERNLEKKLSILAWDAIPNSPNNPSCTISIAKKTSPIVRSEDEDEGESEDEDACSDTSSDLFEIENLSGVAGSQASTPYYAPSERSIEWSVVTASAADNFSSFSDRDDEKTAFTRGMINKNMITNERRKMQRSPTSGGIFLGCTSHKAVDVVGNYTLP